MLDYRLDDGVARLTLDDGRVNALSPSMLHAVDAAFDRALDDDAPVLVTGRPGVFSAGFDLDVLQSGGYAAISMVRTGFEVARRILGHPRPVVAAVSGHAVAMGAFLMLAADHRIAVDGPYRTCANEVRIGLTVPLPAIELLRYRLTPAAFDRAAVLGVDFPAAEAVRAGFYDETVAPDALIPRALAVVDELRAVDAHAFAATKLRARRALLDRMTDAIAADFAAVRAGA